MSKSWRDVASPIIGRVLIDTMGKSEDEIKQAIFDAYPFGERKYHPYKIWLDEIRRQRGTKEQMGKPTAIVKLAEWEAIYGRREA